VEVNRFPGSDIDVADALLSHTADSSVDFMIMGGYGHSRLREFVLGGATRSIFQSMTVPVLLSH
jgi:nucleotide-binding universal stress UspA family protein